MSPYSVFTVSPVSPDLSAASKACQGSDAFDAHRVRLDPGQRFEPVGIVL